MQLDIVRVWKDEEYRESLEQQVESPVGAVELSEAELELINGTGAGGVGKGGGVTKSDSSAVGVKNNSYFCHNFSYHPTTNVNLGGNENRGGLLGALTEGITVALVGTSRTQVNQFDFSCSISSGLTGGVCIFGGGN